MNGITFPLRLSKETSFFTGDKISHISRTPIVLYFDFESK